MVSTSADVTGTVPAFSHGSLAGFWVHQCTRATEVARETCRDLRACPNTS